MSPLQPKPRAWYLPVLLFVLVGPLVAGISAMVEAAIVASGFRGAALPAGGDLHLALAILVIAYCFGIVPAALTGYFHFYARNWLRPNSVRTLATCALGAALGAILPALHQPGPVIVVYAIAGAVAALACVVLTAKLFPVASDGLPPSRSA